MSDTLKYFFKVLEDEMKGDLEVGIAQAVSEAAILALKACTSDDQEFSVEGFEFFLKLCLSELYGQVKDSVRGQDKRSLIIKSLHNRWVMSSLDAMESSGELDIDKNALKAALKDANIFTDEGNGNDNGTLH